MIRRVRKGVKEVVRTFPAATCHWHPGRDMCGEGGREEGTERMRERGKGREGGRDAGKRE